MNQEKPTIIEEVTEVETVTKEKEESVIEDVQTFKEMSPFRLILRRFFRSKLSLVGLIMLVGLFLFAFLGPVIYTKWGETTVDRSEVTREIKTTYTYVDQNGKEITVTEIIEHTSTINSYDEPSKEHLLGTDDNGRDVFVRLMFGGRISLTIGFIVVILETIIGIGTEDFPSIRIHNHCFSNNTGFVLNFRSPVLKVIKWFNTGCSPCVGTNQGLS